jgi:hypothetical protein
VKRRDPRKDTIGFHFCVVDIGLRRDGSIVMVGHKEYRLRSTGAEQNGPPIETLVVDAVTYFRPTRDRPTDLSEVESDIYEMCREFGCYKVHGDSHLADALTPTMRGRGLEYVEVSMGEAEQMKRVSSLAAMFSQGAIRLLDDPTLIRELREAQLKRGAGGHSSVEAGGGAGHGEGVDALLIASSLELYPAPGADGVRVEAMSVNWSTDTRELSCSGRRWFRMTARGYEVELPPPRGTPEWEAAREWRRAKGIYTLEEAQAEEQRRARASLNVSVK